MKYAWAQEQGGSGTGATQPAAGAYIRHAMVTFPFLIVASPGVVIAFCWLLFMVIIIVIVYMPAMNSGTMKTLLFGYFT